MKILPFLAALALVLAAPLLRAQDAPSFTSARTELRREIDSDRFAARIAAIRNMVKTRDVRGVAELRTAMHKVRKEIEKGEKKAEPLLKERGKIDEEIQKRFGTKSSISAGSVQSLIDKKNELTVKIQERDEELRKERRTLDAILVGIGDLIVSLEPAEAGEATNELIDLAKKVRDEDDRLVAIATLGYVRTGEAVLGLVALALNDRDPVTRIGALDALAEQGDSRGADAAVAALDDEFWQVRAAAIRSLSRFGNIGAIDRLVTLVDKEEGRLRDDVLDALRSMTGVDYRENGTLWEKWWTDKRAPLSEALEGLASDVPAVRAQAREVVRDEGFLLGVRRLLDARGVSSNAVRREEARRRVDPEVANTPAPGGVEGVANEDQELESFLDAVGGAIAGRPEEIRDEAVERLLLAPRARTTDDAKRALLTRLVGRSGSPKAARFLAEVLARGSSDTPAAREIRLAAVEGLGYCARAEDLPLLARLFGQDSPDKDVLTAAARSLGRIGTKAAARQLLNALGEIASRRDDAVYAGARKVIGDELRRLTGTSTGDDYKEWLAWWKENGETLETERDKAVAKAGQKEASPEEDGRYGFYGIKTNSKRLCFVLDVSGSMNEPAEYGGSGQTKIEVAKEELGKAISAMPEDAEFNIIIYATDFTLWQKKLVPADAKNKAAAKAWVAKIAANGSTNIYDALAKAFEFAGRGTFDKAYKTALDTIFFLSDGQPTAGRILSTPEIFREIVELNKLRRVVIHTIGVGRDHDANFMRLLAEETGGQYVAR
ncbi:MAG: HEAT repeat domain-containing protein [Planctomycetota bacterium]